VARWISCAGLCPSIRPYQSLSRPSSSVCIRMGRNHELYEAKISGARVRGRLEDRDRSGSRGHRRPPGIRLDPQRGVGSVSASWGSLEAAHFPARSDASAFCGRRSLPHDGLRIGRYKLTSTGAASAAVVSVRFGWNARLRDVHLTALIQGHRATQAGSKLDRPMQDRRSHLTEIVNHTTINES
jgi:hypothetical protein